jgi:hypothetical protein
MAKAAAKKKDTGKINLTPRTKKTKHTRVSRVLDEKYTGPEPVWDGWEKWSWEQFRKEKYRGFYYYNYYNNNKDLIPFVCKWMEKNGYSKEEIRAYNEVVDWKTSTTMGSISCMSLRGMPNIHPEAPADEKSSEDWLREQLSPLIEEGKKILQSKKEEAKNNVIPFNIQDRIRQAAFVVCEEIDDWLDKFMIDPDKFNPKELNVINHFKNKEVNQAHARVIRDYYEPARAELLELTNPPKVKDEMFQQLVEGYSRYTKGQIKNRLAAYEEILAACDMFLQQAKVNRKPRAKKAPSKEKLISKLKFKTSDDRYKLVSIKPEECLQALELWVFNTKTRKLGCYVADDHFALSIKGTTVLNYHEGKSVSKTLRKPEEQLKGANSLPRTKMRKLYDAVNSMETKMNGRINADIVLLKAYS